jgi:hypothetical protein
MPAEINQPTAVQAMEMQTPEEQAARLSTEQPVSYSAERRSGGLIEHALMELPSALLSP